MLRVLLMLEAAALMMTAMMPLALSAKEGTGRRALESRAYLHQAGYGEQKQQNASISANLEYFHD